MEILLYLLPLSLVLGLIALVGFLWALNSEQFEDMEGNAWRVLNDEDEGEP